MILSAMGAVFSIFLMIGAGVFVHQKKWVSRQGASVFSKIVINIAVPASVIYSFLTKVNRQQVLGAWKHILVILLAMLISYLASKLVATLLKVKKQRRGLFSALFAFSNSVFIGFPLALAVFGEVGMLYAVLFFMVNTTMFWTFGYFGIRKDARIITGSKEKVKFKEAISKIFSAPLLSVFVGVALMLLNIKLPLFIMDTIKYLSGLTSPLSLMFTGIVLADIGFKNLGFEWDVLKVMLGRVLIAPVIMLAMTMVFGVSGLGQQVFIVQMTLPVMLQSVISSEYYGADANFATKAFAWTTGFSLISIPIYVVLASLI